MTDKKLTFIIYGDPVHEAVVVGVEGLLEYIESRALELSNGETMMHTIKRQDKIEASSVKQN